MKRQGTLLCTGVGMLLFVDLGFVGQQPQATEDRSDHVLVTALKEAAVVSRIIRFSGIVKDAGGRVATGTIALIFSLYQFPEGGAPQPLWGAGC
ncbi:MAG TPA: hypothetical protein VGW33_11140 [Terriglobia bacterium]|nr:hypothetical protein [Terriglobia bacterium]